MSPVVVAGAGSMPYEANRTSGLSPVLAPHCPGHGRGLPLFGTPSHGCNGPAGALGAVLGLR